MITIYKENDDKTLTKMTIDNNSDLDLNSLEKGSWIHIDNPDSNLLENISKITNLPLDFLLPSLDEEESARVDFDDDNTLIVLDSPYAIEENKGLYTTAPFIISFNKDFYVTIQRHKFALVDEILKRVKLIEPHKHIRLSIYFLYRLATMYILYLKKINAFTDSIENLLRTSTKNKEVLELMDVNKSLIYFATALNANKIVLSKLFKTKQFREFENDFDLMEDAQVELDQATEMCSISRSVLTGMMDAFASIINNNLNVVMKTLTIVTIVLSIPTLVSSFYGMNVNDLPLASEKYSFYIVLAISAVLAILAATLLTIFTSRQGRRRK